MLEGSIVALVTPFNESMEVNYLKLEELVEIQCDSDTDGVVVLGSTSESSTLTREEKNKILQTVINKNKGRMKIVAGIITNNTLEAIEISKNYEKLGADYLLVVAPFYIKPNKAGIVKHFKSIAQSVSIPIIIYNVPSRCGVNIDYESLKEIKMISNIIGVKESNKDINHILDIFKLSDCNFKIYCGNDELSYLFLSHGAKGLINVYGNLNPVIMKKILNLYNNKHQLAYDYFYKFYDIFKLLNSETNPIAIKALMNYEDMNVGNHRLPLDVMEENKYNEFINIYKKLSIQQYSHFKAMD